jgi:hypothetical protein
VIPKEPPVLVPQIFKDWVWVCLWFFFHFSLFFFSKNGTQIFFHLFNLGGGSSFDSFFFSNETNSNSRFHNLSFQFLDSKHQNSQCKISELLFQNILLLQMFDNVKLIQNNLLLICKLHLFIGFLKVRNLDMWFHVIGGWWNIVLNENFYDDQVYVNVRNISCICML